MFRAASKISFARWSNSLIVWSNLTTTRRPVPVKGKERMGERREAAGQGRVAQIARSFDVTEDVTPCHQPNWATLSSLARTLLLPFAPKPAALSFFQGPIYRKPLGQAGRASAPLDPLIVGRVLQLRLLKLLEPFGQHAKASEESGGNAHGFVPEFLLGQEEEQREHNQHGERRRLEGLPQVGLLVGCFGHDRFGPVVRQHEALEDLVHQPQGRIAHEQPPAQTGPELRPAGADQPPMGDLVKQRLLARRTGLPQSPIKSAGLLRRLAFGSRRRRDVPRRLRVEPLVRLEHFAPGRDWPGDFGGRFALTFGLVSDLEIERVNAGDHDDRPGFVEGKSPQEPQLLAVEVQVIQIIVEMVHDQGQRRVPQEFLQLIGLEEFPVLGPAQVYLAELAWPQPRKVSFGDQVGFAGARRAEEQVFAGSPNVQRRRKAGG